MTNGFSNTSAGESRPIRIAAISDLHLRTTFPEQLANELRAVSNEADVLVVPGDITDNGKIPEVEVAGELLREVTIPTIAVLGNHDRRGIRRKAMRTILDRAGVNLLDGDALSLTLEDGRRIGFAGVGGYGGGFWPEDTPDLVGARISKAVGVRARRESLRLDQALAQLGGQQLDAMVVVMHYAPTVSTLGNEPVAKYWMLGNSLLGNVVDRYPVDLVLHGHAHLGNKDGHTTGGVPVRNVAAPVTGGRSLFEVRAPRQVNDLTDEHSSAAIVTRTQSEVIP